MGPAGQLPSQFLKATNGQTIAVSEACTTRSSALNGIEAVRTNAPSATIVETNK